MVAEVAEWINTLQLVVHKSKSNLVSCLHPSQHSKLKIFRMFHPRKDRPMQMVGQQPNYTTVQGLHE